jgi:hypothetical protein
MRDLAAWKLGLDPARDQVVVKWAIDVTVQTSKNQFNSSVGNGRKIKAKLPLRQVHSPSAFQKKKKKDIESLIS